MSMSETLAKPAEGPEGSDRAQATVVRAGGRAGGREWGGEGRMGREAVGHSPAAKGGVCEGAAAGVEGERVLGCGSHAHLQVW